MNNPVTRERPLTVTQLNEYIKTLLDGAPLLDGLYLKGEISNFTNHRTGHFYFTLKDEGSLIRAVMFRSSAEKLKFLPENGMKIIVHGRVAVFPRDGQYQLYCSSMEPDGIGALYAAFEQLKQKLSQEGLFDSARKKPLPRFPASVGIITSPTGAAVRDMINILTRRFKFARIILCPSLVQGEKAPANLISGLRYFNASGRADVIIIGRGGGSIEDLWAFNDEGLAREIANSRIPVISAVGHETDFTICDFAADLRAPTPSAAAELAVPDTAELLLAIEAKRSAMVSRISARIANERRALEKLAGRKVLSSLAGVFDEKRMTILRSEQLLHTQFKLRLSEKRSNLTARAAKLEAYSPMKTLARGYSVVTSVDGTAVTSVKQLKQGDRLNIRTADGKAETAVTEVYYD